MTHPAQVDAQALVALSAQVLPVWARQLATSRDQSEVAVADMLAAFTEIGPHLDRAARQSHQITQALAQGDDGVTQLASACDAVLQPVMAGCTPQASQAIGKVMGMIHACVDALEQIAKPFEHETQMVSQQVDRMYQGFQYQDRVSQMMTVLLNDMAHLQQALAQPDTALSPTEWLARLESTYVMREQHQQHSTSGKPEHGAAGAETTFF
jgi:uncharacterized protein YukE